VVDLRRSKVHERCNEHDVRRLLAVERVQLPASGHRLFELAEDPDERLAPTRSAEYRDVRQHPDEARGPLFGPPSQPRRPVIARVEKAQIVDPEPQLAPEIGPRARLAARRPADRHVRIFGGNALDHPGAAERLLSIGGQMHHVAARGQFDDRGLEQAQV
jgi:hypothetical protein